MGQVFLLFSRRVSSLEVYKTLTSDTTYQYNQSGLLSLREKKLLAQFLSYYGKMWLIFLLGSILVHFYFSRKVRTKQLTEICKIKFRSLEGSLEGKKKKQPCNIFYLFSSKPTKSDPEIRNPKCSNDKRYQLISTPPKIMMTIQNCQKPLTRTNENTTAPPTHPLSYILLTFLQVNSEYLISSGW